MEANLAVPAKQAEKVSPTDLESSFDRVERAAAELYAKGWSRGSVARKMEPHLLTVPQSRMKPTRRRVFAMKKLRRLERRKDFRDLIYQYALEITDSKSGAILKGITDRAVRGRVDAAKFALELAGRYTPKGHDTPTAVTIAINGVPRPMAIAAPPGDVIEATEYVEETDGPDGPGL